MRRYNDNLSLLHPGKEKEALKVLHEWLMNRFNRKAWTPAHEDVVKLMLSICLDVVDSPMTKEALICYRAQETNPMSLEKIIYSHIENIRKKNCRGEIGEGEGGAVRVGESSHRGSSAQSSCLQVQRAEVGGTLLCGDNSVHVGDTSNDDRSGTSRKSQPSQSLP